MTTAPTTPRLADDAQRGSHSVKRLVTPLRPKALDLYCCAGGAAMGLYRAGFDVTGVDIKPQPRYPFRFIQGDALDQDLSGYDFVWASPPCQAYTRMSKGLLESQGRQREHPKLVEATRDKLRRWGGPYIIENVVGAPLINPVMLCGSSFGLLVQRHRLFESNVMLLELPCEHGWQTKDKPSLHRLQGRSRVVGCYGNGRGKGDNLALWSLAMGIDWMTRREIAQAIPPAFSQYLARQILWIIGGRNAELSGGRPLNETTPAAIARPLK